MKNVVSAVVITKEDELPKLLLRLVDQEWELPTFDLDSPLRQLECLTKGLTESLGFLPSGDWVGDDGPLVIDGMQEQYVLVCSLSDASDDEFKEKVDSIEGDDVEWCYIPLLDAYVDGMIDTDIFEIVAHVVSH